MQVRNMGMRMPDGFMSVWVTMWAIRHRVMTVIVMTIIVDVSVFMLHRFMLMLMPVRFSQMDDHARHHERASNGESQAA